MKRVYFVFKIRPKIRSWEVLKVFKNHEDSLKFRDKMQLKAEKENSKCIFCVQSAVLE